MITAALKLNHGSAAVAFLVFIFLGGGEKANQVRVLGACAVAVGFSRACGADEVFAFLALAKVVVDVAGLDPFAAVEGRAVDAICRCVFEVFLVPELRWGLECGREGKGAVEWTFLFW